MTTLRFCFVGDSLVNGTNDTEFLGWPGRLAKDEVAQGHDVTVYNMGIRGDTSEMVERRWRAECEARMPAIQPCALVFSFGVNDIADENGVRRVELDKSLEIAQTMMSEAKAWLPTLWVGPPPVELDETTFIPAPKITYVFTRERIAELNLAYKKIATKHDIPYFDSFNLLKGRPHWEQSYDGSDGVHPMGEGYAEFSRNIGKWDAWRKCFDT